MFMWWVLSTPMRRVARSGRRRRCRRRRRGDARPSCRTGRTSAPASVQQTSTHRSRLIRPSMTPWYSRSIRCSTEPMPLGILAKLPMPHLLLVLHAERAVVGRHGRDVAGADVLPQLVLVTLGPRRAAASSRPTSRPRNPARRVFSSSDRYRYCGQVSPNTFCAGVAGLGDARERLLGRDVHDVERRAGQVGQHDRAVGGLLLGLPRPGDAVEVRVGLAALERLLHEHVDGRAVLGVHHDQRRRCRPPSASPAGSARRWTGTRPGRP